jgi:hypothetical protein
LAAGATNPISSVQRESATRWNVAFSGGRRLELETAIADGGGFRVIDVSPSGERREHAIRAR